ncbi:uracil-DNA glycosylase, partial [Candidatus Symbiopectobacterium sp. NZEC135]
MISIPPTTPKSLKDPSNIQIRNALLSSSHMQPLNRYVKKLRETLGPTVFIPDFDPLDGGIDAEFIFLLEKPGPKTDKRNIGSGFISRDNNDETAKNIFNFMNAIGLDRNRTILWNTIPYWDGGRRFKADDVKYGIQLLDGIFALLPKKK